LGPAKAGAEGAISQLPLIANPPDVLNRASNNGIAGTADAIFL
jgi:hypothetical protein